MSDNKEREPMAAPLANNAVSARQAVKAGNMRYVLGISLVLVVVAFVLAWMYVRL